MDMKDTIKMRASQTMDELLDKIDRICDDARDSDEISDDDVCVLLDCWKTLHSVRMTLTACGIGA